MQEIAEHMGLSEEEVVEVLESSHASDYISLDGLGLDNGSERGFSLIDHIGAEDGEFSITEYRTTIARLMEHLDEREQRIIYMRFFQGLTQVEIARELGISQMHVSRLLNKILHRLRDVAEE
jgi:RNA polymerase sigma-B factor